MVDLARAAKIDVAAAGSPVRGEAGNIARALGAQPIDDLRAEMTAAELDLVLLASPGAFGTDAAQDDVAAVLAANAKGAKIATLEPVPARALDLAAGPWRGSGSAPRPANLVRFIPLARLSTPFRNATEVLESFGPARTLSVECWCRAVEGSVGARFFSAMELVLALMGEPETIDAAHVAPNSGGALRTASGESLRGLHGEITALLRFGDGESATVVAGDRGGRWNRAVTMIGAKGRLRVFDDGFEWVGPDGERVDHSRSETSERGEEPEISHAVTTIADALRRLLDPAQPDDGPTNQAGVLAMTQAALLSAQTGQPESPTTIRKLIGAT